MTTRADQRAALAAPGHRTGTPSRAGRSPRLVTGRGDRFGALLLILIFTYVLSAFTEGGLVSAIQVVLFLIVVLLALRTGQLHRRTLRFVALGLVLGTIVSGALQLAAHDKPVAGFAELWTALILLLSITLILRRVLARPDISVQSIYGAISAYMIIGLMFAAVYAAVYHFHGNMFFVNRHPPFTTSQFQYFSFTTLTTLGYGDYTTALSGGQALAMLEAMAGQIFLATLVARLVAGFRGTQRGAARRAQSQPAGARRASARRASALGMVQLRPRGAARGPRSPNGGRPGGRSRAGPGPEPETRRDTPPG